VNHPITKSSLSDAQSRLIQLLQQINFGRLELLQVRGGEPMFEPPPRIIRKLKLGADNAPRPEASLQDFWLKHQTVEMLQEIADLGDGEVLSIEIKNGLPFLIEIEHSIGRAGGLLNA
jgi:hypothetical protein